MRLKKLHFEGTRESKSQEYRCYRVTVIPHLLLHLFISFWKSFSSWGVLLFSILQSETSQVQGSVTPSTSAGSTQPKGNGAGILHSPCHCYSWDTGKTSPKWLESSPSKHLDLCCKPGGLWSQRCSSCLSSCCRYNDAVWTTGNWTLLWIFHMSGFISRRRKLNGRESRCYQRLSRKNPPDKRMINGG